MGDGPFFRFCGGKAANPTGGLSYNGLENNGIHRRRGANMPVTCREDKRQLTALVAGELDHHEARTVMEELDRRIDLTQPRELTLDLSGLTFADSSGIAVLLRAHRR